MLYCITDRRKGESIDNIKSIEEELNMLALAGTIQGNTVIIENDNITNYDGKEVILTILDRPYKADRKKIDWDKYGMETDRGKHVEEYMGEIRNNDRI